MSRVENIEVVNARYAGDKKLVISFNTGEEKTIDFSKAFAKLKGYYARFTEPARFKRFIVKGGNVYWGRNEDVIYPVYNLYTGNLLARS